MGGGGQSPRRIGETERDRRSEPYSSRVGMSVMAVTAERRLTEWGEHRHLSDRTVHKITLVCGALLEIALVVLLLN